MSSSGRSNQAAPRSPRQGRGRSDAPNRAQVKAMQARSIVRPMDPGTEVGAAAAVDGVVAGRSTSGVVVAEEVPVGGVLPRRTRSRAVARVVPLPRNVEFAYIRSDMRRLLAIAGVLLVLMLALLIVVGR